MLGWRRWAAALATMTGMLAVPAAAQAADVECSFNAGTGVATVTEVTLSGPYDPTRARLTATALQYAANRSSSALTQCAPRTALQRIVFEAPSFGVTNRVRFQIDTDLAGGSAEADGTPEIEVDVTGLLLELKWADSATAPPVDVVTGSPASTTYALNTNPRQGTDADADITCACPNLMLEGRTNLANRFSSAGGFGTGAGTELNYMGGGELADRFDLGGDRDVVEAHGGNDVFFGAQDGGVDLLYCGAGTDTLDVPDAADVLEDCEVTGTPVTWSVTNQTGPTPPAPFEGQSATLQVRLSAPLPFEASVLVTTVGGGPGNAWPATSGQDFVHRSERVTVPAGQTQVPFTVQTLQDTKDEGREFLRVTLSDPWNATGVHPTTPGGLLAIDDDDPPPTVSLSPIANVTEGSPATATVALSAPFEGPDRTVTLSTAPGTASAADFTSLSNQTVTFASGETSKTVSLPTTQDALDEPDETFTVTLTGAADLPLGSPASRTVTIVDNDPAPAITTAAPAVDEGEDVVLTLTPDRGYEGGPARTVRVSAPDPQTVTFPEGAPAAQTVRVPTADDDVDGPDTTVQLTVDQPSGVTVAPAQATRTVTVRDDDGPPVVSLGDATATEGDAVTLPVSLAGRSAGDVVLDVTVTPDSAGAADIGDVATTVTVPALATGTTIAVPALADGLDEDDEALQVSVAVAAGSAPATLGDATATATITDGDPAPVASMADATVEEGGTARVPVTLTGRSATPLTLDVTVAGGTAGDEDRTVPATIVVPAGADGATVEIPTVDDDLDEPDETTALKVGESTATLTIVDNDAAPAPEPTATPTASATVEPTPEPTATPTVTPTVSPIPRVRPCRVVKHRLFRARIFPGGRVKVTKTRRVRRIKKVTVRRKKLVVRVRLRNGDRRVVRKAYRPCAKR